MPTVNQLTTEQLENEAIFPKVANLVGELAATEQISRALAMAEQMKIALSRLKNTGSPALKKYQRLQALLWWTAFPALTEEDAAQTTKTGLLIALLGGLDAEEKIQARLFTSPLPNRTEVVKNIRAALEQNNEEIGGQKISDWLVLYNQFQDFTRRNNLSASDFLNQSQAAQQLNAEQRIYLKMIFGIYDRNLLAAPIFDQEDTEVAWQRLLRENQTDTTRVLPAKPTTPMAPAPARKKNPSGNQDKYRELVAPGDLKNKYKIEPPARQSLPKEPVKQEETVINPLNVVDLREK